MDAKALRNQLEEARSGGGRVPPAMQKLALKFAEERRASGVSMKDIGAELGMRRRAHLKTEIRASHGATAARQSPGSRTPQATYSRCSSSTDTTWNVIPGAGAGREDVMHNEQNAAPDNTAVTVALWRALHVEVDAPPHVLEDEVGLKLAAPDDGWRSRPDMSPFTRPFRAFIVARARFIEDLVAEQAARGVGQYVILGAGLDTFAQRRPELASRLSVF